MNTTPDRNSTLKTAGLGAALAFLATEAAAEVVYTDNSDVSYSCYSSVSASFNPITGATATGGYPQQAIGLMNFNCGGCSTSAGFYFGCSAGTLTSVGFLNAPVTAGTLIDASTGSWVDGTYYGSQVTNANFTGYGVNDHALVAYRFKTSADAGTYLYGWAEFSTGGYNPANVSLYSFAYEDAGAGILAGSTSAIPEPGATAAIFGLFAVCVIGFRRLRQRTVRA